MGYPLNAARLADLVCAHDDVADLLEGHAALLPVELKTRLNTFACDLAAVIEDRGLTADGAIARKAKANERAVRNARPVGCG